MVSCQIKVPKRRFDFIDTSFLDDYSGAEIVISASRRTSIAILIPSRNPRMNTSHSSRQESSVWHSRYLSSIAFCSSVSIVSRVSPCRNNSLISFCRSSLRSRGNSFGCILPLPRFFKYAHNCPLDTETVTVLSSSL